MEEGVQLTMADDRMENWRQFQGTELGSLMGSLYGNQNKPKINYPKPKTKPSNLDHTRGFQYCGAKPEATDPRKSTRRDVKLNVPRLNGGRKSDSEPMGLIDIMPKRRNADKIKDEIDEIVMRNTNYRPAHTRNVTSDAEKDRYSQICTFKGGKGLPEGLTLPQGTAPFEMAAKRKEAENRDAVRNNRLGKMLLVCGCPPALLPTLIFLSSLFLSSHCVR